MAQETPAYWLVKTEPAEFGIDDLAAAPQQTARWDGIRNYQARNFIRGQMAQGDWVLVYHSKAQPTAVVGLAEVISPAYPDPTQFEPQSRYFDPKSSPAEPRWYCIDIRLREKFACPMSLAQIKAEPALQYMALLKQARLSVVPVHPNAARLIITRCRTSSKGPERTV